MRAQEFIVENTNQAAIDALMKKHGWNMGRIDGDLAFTWQGNSYRFQGERMRITFPDGQSMTVIWGKRPDWQGRPGEASFAQAVQNKHLTFDLPIWQALDRGQITDQQAIQQIKAETERQAQEAVTQGITEGPFVQRIVHPKNVSIYVRAGAKKSPVLVATNIPYNILDKYINKVISKYPQFKSTDFSFRSSDRVTEGQEEFNQAVMQPGFKFKQEINGVVYKVINKMGMPEMVALDKQGQVIGAATFWEHPTLGGLESLSTHVDKAWQGKGIAANMYAVMRMLGVNINPSANRTAMGKAMWAKWSRQGDAKHIKNLNPKVQEQNVTEGTLSVDVPNEDWLQGKIDYAKSKGRDSYGVPYFGSTTASVQGTPPRVRLTRLASLPGMKNEQHNVRKNDLAWLMDYMERTGKLPPGPSGREYMPYIMVAYNGEAWVNDGNHRIMSAYRLNWPDLPVEIRYFDGGERVASGPMAPGKIGLA